jgi:hypothetical protein
MDLQCACSAVFAKPLKVQLEITPHRSKRHPEQRQTMQALEPSGIFLLSSGAARAGKAKNADRRLA